MATVNIDIANIWSSSITNHNTSVAVWSILARNSPTNASYPSTKPQKLCSSFDDKMAGNQERVCPEYVDDYNDYGFTKLNLACWVGDFPEAWSLLEEGAHPNGGSGLQQYTPLHSSSFQGHLDIVKLLLKFGADINAQEAEGYTPLNGAIWNNHQDVALFLINNNADFTLYNNNRFTPLMSAVWVGNLVLVQTLVEKGADVNISSIDGFTALHAAATTGHLEVARFLVENNARLDALDYQGRTPLCLAQEYRNNHFVEFFENLINN
ncbi:protein fem-1 homolog A-like [Zophobas morio]|uniref:protein fem-1 homolog A-like n=1 Tax=Zophobas morio TaxID=2755281 RepID=UPI0030837C9A